MKDLAQTATGVALGIVGLFAVTACDSSGQSGGNAGNGQGGTSAQARPTLLSSNRYQVAAPAALFGSGGQSGAIAGTGGTGTNGGNGSGGASSPAAGSPGFVCVPAVPSGTTQNVCGDGFLNSNEQCDDGNTADGDACSSTCIVTPSLVAPHAASTSVLPPPGRELGKGAHPTAVGCNRVGVSFLDRSTTPAALELASFSSVGHAQGVVEFGAADVDSANPSLAALPDDTFVAAWTSFDDDELGIRLRKVDPGASTQSAATFANGEQGFSQRAPDVAFDGKQIVVAWVDDSDPVNGPDLRYRTFAPDLSPTSGDLTLTATDAVEDQVTLAAIGGHWAAAWRSGSAGGETIEVQSGATHWSVGPFLPGASDDRPALAFVDGTHLALAFTKGTDPGASSVANVPRLHAAILDTAYPGQTESFEVKPTVEPYASMPSLAQTEPAIASYGDRVIVAWRSSSAIGDPAGDELWSREIKWSAGAVGTLALDTSSPEKLLINGGALRAGDQSSLSLLSSSAWPDHRLLSVWQEDSHRVLQGSSGLPDVLLQFSQTPDALPSLPTGICNLSALAISPPGPAVDFTSVTLTATATCGPGSEPEYQFGFQSPDQTTFTLIRGWGPPVANWSTAGLPSGNYPVYAYVRRKGSTVPFDSNGGLGYLVGKVCYKDAVFQATPSGVQPIGTVLSLSATATCSGNGTTPEHLSYYYLPGSSSYFKIGDWSTLPVNWNTAGLPSGSYTLITYLRGQGNKSGFESYVYGGALLGNVCYTVNSVSFSPSTAQAIGAPVVLSATATCVGATAPEFRYYYYGPNSGTPIPIGTWSSSPVTWDTTAFPAGNYSFLAYVRGVGNDSGQEASGYSTSKLALGPTCPSVSIGVSPTAPKQSGTAVSVVATAGCTPAEYAFSYRLWGNTAWQLFRDWSTSPTATWDTTGLASGNWELRVDARYAGHIGAEITSQTSYLIGDVCIGVSVQSSPPSPKPVGTTVALSASSTCTNGATAEYQFYYWTAGGYTLLRDWGPATFSWSTTSLTAGGYSIYAYARAIGNADTYDGAIAVPYTLQ